MQDPELQRQVSRLNRSLRKLAGAVVFAALLMGSVQLYLADAGALTWVTAGAGVLTLLWLILP